VGILTKPLRAAIFSVALSLPLVLLSGCAPAAGSPEQAVTEFFAALANRDFASAWGLVDATQQEQLATELAQLQGDGEHSAERAKRLARNFGGEFAPSDVSLSPSDYFAKAMASAVESDAELKTILKTPPKVLDTSGDASSARADVVVKFGDGPGAPKVIQCVRDGSGWRVRIRP